MESSKSGGSGFQLKKKNSDNTVTIIEPPPQIEWGEKLGVGSFGSVFKASFENQKFACKCFETREAYERELKIFKGINIRNRNILRFIGADLLDNRENRIAYSLLVPYHPAGSLFDFLQSNIINIGDMYCKAASIIAGVHHLHKTIQTSPFFRNKPAMAHRDLKSKNILVKSDGSCAIADFGMAVMETERNKIDLEVERCVGGTVRYLPPEVLSNQLDKNMIQEWQRGDMYALGIVLWELLSRCKVTGTSGKYELPYHNYVRQNPTVQEMYQVVVINRARPKINNNLRSNNFLKQFTKAITSCWCNAPSDRVTAASLHTRFKNYQQNNHKTDYDCFFNRLLDKKITIFGVESSNRVTINVMRTLIVKGAMLHIYDPKVEESQIMSDLSNGDSTVEPELVESRVSIFKDAYSATKYTHAIVVCAKRKEFLKLDYEQIYANMDKPYIYDAYEVLNKLKPKLSKIGFYVENQANEYSPNVLKRTWSNPIKEAKTAAETVHTNYDNLRHAAAHR